MAQVAKHLMVSSLHSMGEGEANNFAELGEYLEEEGDESSVQEAPAKKAKVDSSKGKTDATKGTKGNKGGGKNLGKGDLQAVAATAAAAALEAISQGA